VALGTITGDYVYRAELPAQHTRSVRWTRTEVSRSGLGSDLLTAPSLTSVYRINVPEAASRIASVMAHGDVSAAEVLAQPAPTAAPRTAIDNFRRNLEYAMSLASAGYYLQKLKVEAFEVSDVFRAAWVQAVASLDHWVHQEMHDRMLIVANWPESKRPKGFASLKLPPGLAGQVSSGTLTLAQAVDQGFQDAFGYRSYQNPAKIEQGLAYVIDVGDLWSRVAQVLTERGEEGESPDAASVQQRLTEVVFRRNKIAHEWDEDPANPPHKRHIDAAMTTQSIKWVGQAVEAMLVVLDGA
jgi:restriction system protein